MQTNTNIDAHYNKSCARERPVGKSAVHAKPHLSAPLEL